MSIESLQKIFDMVSEAIAGSYGWVNEILALVIFVIVFNFILKWGLIKLHKKLEMSKRIWQDCFVCAVLQPLSYYVWFFVFIHVTDLIAFKSFAKDITYYLNPLLTFGAVSSFSWFLFRYKKNIINNLTFLINKKQIAWDRAKVDVVDKLGTLFILFISLLILLESTHKNLNTLIAFGGVGGLALAIASQEVVSNFFGGIMIYTTHPFSKGDWIQVPDRSIEGIVEEIGWYMTLVRSLDKRPIYVPNSIFTKTVVITPSRMTHRRFKEIIGLRYTDLPALKNIMNDIFTMLKNNPDVDCNNTLIVNLDAFGSYSLDILVQADLVILDSVGYAKAKDKLLFQIAQIVADHNANFASPYPIALSS